MTAADARFDHLSIGKLNALEWLATSPGAGVKLTRGPARFRDGFWPRKRSACAATTFVVIGIIMLSMLSK